MPSQAEDVSDPLSEMVGDAALSPKEGVGDGSTPAASSLPPEGDASPPLLNACLEAAEARAQQAEAQLVDVKSELATVSRQFEAKQATDANEILRLTALTESLRSQVSLLEDRLSRLSTQPPPQAVSPPEAPSSASLVKSLQEDIARTRHDLSELQEAYRASQEEVSRLAHLPSEIVRLEAQVASKQQEVQSLHSQLQTSQTKLSESQLQYEARISMAEQSVAATKLEMESIVKEKLTSEAESKSVRQQLEQVKKVCAVRI